MLSINKVTGSMIGYLGSEPRISWVGEKRIARAFYCVVRRGKGNDSDTGEGQARRVVLPLVSWGKQAEADAKFLHKGSQVAVCFRIDNVRYDRSVHARELTRSAPRAAQCAFDRLRGFIAR